MEFVEGETLAQILGRLRAQGNEEEEKRSLTEQRNRLDGQLASAVQDSVLLGVNNNRLFLQNILRHPVFLEGGATTAFIGEQFAEGGMASPAPGGRWDGARISGRLHRRSRGPARGH